MQFILAEEQNLTEWSIRVDFLAAPVEGAVIDGDAVSASRKTRLAFCASR
jgi:hypothetical protein